MQITENRLKHILAVAMKMKAEVSKHPEDYPCSPDDAFILGFLHDIGYEFSTTQSEHPNKGGLALKEQGYKYWKEIYYHGIPQDEYNSPLLDLLNYADMTTSPSGENMTIKQRIDDIALRYGKGSKQELDAIKLSKTFTTL